VAVPKQAIGAFDAVAQIGPTTKASANLGQGQTRSADRRDHGFKQHIKPPPVDAVEQRCDTTA
jgi:hypothetical protein